MLYYNKFPSLKLLSKNSLLSWIENTNQDLSKNNGIIAIFVLAYDSPGEIRLFMGLLSNCVSTTMIMLLTMRTCTYDRSVNATSRHCC